MTFRVLARVTVALALALPLTAAGQTGSQPRTPDGRPDLQGVWDFRTVTPLERPEDLSDRAFLTEEEAAEIETGATDRRNVGLAPSEVRTEPLPAGGEGAAGGQAVGGYNEFWFDRGTNVAGNQTSLIIDPPDGQVPDLVPEARERFREAAEYGRAHPADSYTDRPLSERCVTYGVPRLGAGYNSYYQVFQSKDYVVILHEMNHDARVIPLIGLPHVDDDVRQLHGDSRGHWEGDTLVVETKNFSKVANFRGSSDGLHMIERLTRESPEVLRYEVTLTDSSVWTKPWTVSIPLVYSEEPMFEYACHEGNIGMEGILAGHRAEEREAGQ